MTGMWPSEGSVSEEALRILIQNGISWAASDQEILEHSLRKSGLGSQSNPIHTVYEFDSSLKLLFRDHALSDRIGFVYSSWEADAAAKDFIHHIKLLRSVYIDSLEDIVVPIILDGENAWEYFPNDGAEFLKLFYQQLEQDDEIEAVTFGEAAASIIARPLPKVFAGSWINHNFRIWIGHSEDNTAWDLLSQARNDLVAFEREHPDHPPEQLEAAWRQIYIAEGSDWCWWYGDEHRGDHNAEFDRIYRHHLIAVYELLGMEIPFDLLKVISSDASEAVVLMPECRLTPEINGRVSHFYEWIGAGFFDCTKAGGAMHQVERLMTAIRFAYDRECFHIRLDFHSRKVLESLEGLKIVVTIFVPNELTIEIDPDAGTSEHDKIRWAVGDIVELSVARDLLWPDSFGQLSFNVVLYQRDQKLESWPECELIDIEVPHRDREILWPF